MSLALNLKPDLSQLAARARSALAFRQPELPDVVLAVGSISLVIVCLGLLGVPGYHQLQLRAKAAAVVGNAATVQLAAETYAAAHQGRYATDPLDLLLYLPADTAPLNPYTGQKIEFRGAAGDLIYRSPTGGGQYTIEAFAMGGAGRPRLIKVLSGRRPR